MSYIEAISQASTAQAKSESTSNDASDILGKEDFLTLLVAQLQNQDPLNPDEPTEFTAQLAQFSSLEQLFNLNESMSEMSSAIADSQKMSALSLIGKEAAYFSSDLTYDGSPVKIGYSLDGAASSVNLLLKHNGTVVATLEGTELTAGNHFLTWNGLDSDGAAAPVGDYTVVIEAVAEEGSIAAAPLIRSEVKGVDLEGDNGGLLFTRSGEVNVNDIIGVYELSSSLDDDEDEESTTTTNETTTVAELVEELITTEQETDSTVTESL